MKKTVQIFKALADETRLRILLLLIENGELCVCDLMAALEMPQSTVSRHLAYLRTSGWVEGRRQGVWMHYRLVEAREGLLTALRDGLKLHLGAIEEAQADRARLAAHLAAKTASVCAA